MAAVKCPRCHRYKMGVSEEAIDNQIEEDGAFQCSSCGHQFNPYAEAGQVPQAESDAAPSLDEFIARRKP